MADGKRADYSVIPRSGRRYRSASTRGTEVAEEYPRWGNRDDSREIARIDELNSWLHADFDD
jgi:hypothetical protein